MGAHGAHGRRGEAGARRTHAAHCVRAQAGIYSDLQYKQQAWQLGMQRYACMQCGVRVRTGSSAL